MPDSQAQTPAQKAIGYLSRTAQPSQDGSRGL